MAEQVRHLSPSLMTSVNPRNPHCGRRRPAPTALLSDVLHILAVTQAPHSPLSKQMFKNLNTYEDSSLQASTAPSYL